jgi:hypothetical protein
MKAKPKTPFVSDADRRELARIERAFRKIDKLTGFKPARPVDPGILQRLKPSEDTVVCLDSRRLATILAALRHYQESGLADDPTKRSDAIHDIATNGGAFPASMCGEEIDELCERLNFAERITVGRA